VKVLVVGLGGAGQRLVRHTKELLGPNVEFVAYRARGRKALIKPDFTIDPEVTVERQFRIRTSPTLKEALAMNPDVAIIANPTHLHMETALACAKAGCHLLIEKPLGHEWKGMAELKKALRGRVGMVGYMMRFHPCLKRIEEIVTSRLLGKVLWAKLEAGSYVPSWHPYEDYAELYAVRRAMGGGVVLTESHELDLATWFFGAPKSVTAVGGKLTKHAGDAEDTASILLDCGFPVHVNLCFMQRPASRQITVALEHGRLDWAGGNHLRVFNAEKNAWAEFAADGHERDHLFRDQVKHFFACVDGREKPLVDIDAGMASLDIALKALKQIWS